MLFCHWALHVTLTRPGTTWPFLRRIDEYLENNLGPSPSLTDGGLFQELAFLETFQSQLRQFFVTHNLATALTDDDSKWQTFLTYYAGVIEDGSIACGGNSTRLRHVDRVYLSEAGDSLGDGVLTICHQMANRVQRWSGGSDTVEPVAPREPEIGWFWPVPFEEPARCDRRRRARRSAFWSASAAN